jgi:hypothetical protein
VDPQALVEEKETRAKETMYIMGLKSWVFSLSWVVTYMVCFYSDISTDLCKGLNYSTSPRKKTGEPGVCQ